MNAVVISLSIVLLVAGKLCIYQAHTKKTVRRHRETKLQGPCKNEQKKFCLNGGECYFLVDEDIVDSI